MHHFNWSRSPTHLHVVIDVVLWLAAVRSWGVAHDIGVLRYVADRKPFHVRCLQSTTLAGFGNACRREVVHDPVVVVICSQERSKQGEREQKKKKPLVISIGRRGGHRQSREIREMITTFEPACKKRRRSKHAPLWRKKRNDSEKEPTTYLLRLRL